MGQKKVHLVGIIFNTFFYLIRMLFNSAYVFYAVDLSDRLVSGSYALPIMSAVYEKARKLGGSDFILFREIALHQGIIFALFVGGLFIRFTDSWKWIFIFAILGGVLTYGLEKKEKLFTWVH